MITLGIDVGGTFTDLVLRDSVTGTMRALKTPSTPSNHAEGVMNAIRSTGVAPSEITAIGHGMTVATNTALEMNGARLGIITTRGFRDVLVIGRGNRTKLYDIKATRPEPLVERRNIVEVDGRLTAAETRRAMHVPNEPPPMAATRTAGLAMSVPRCWPTSSPPAPRAAGAYR